MRLGYAKSVKIDIESVTALHDNLIPLTHSTKYEKFMLSRDRVLENLLTRYQGFTSAVVDELKKKTLEIARSYLHHGISHYDARKYRKDFEKRIQPWFDIAAEEATALVKRLRRSTYALTYIGATEGIARAMAGTDPYRISASMLDQIESKDAPAGGSLRHRMDLVFSRLLRDVADAFQLSQVAGGDNDELLARLDRAFPRKVENVKKRAVMAKLREARDTFKPDYPGRYDGSGPSGVNVSTGVIDPEEWSQILEDYYSEHFPIDSPNRTPYSRVYYSEEPTDEGRYEWELESDITEDFVRVVRAGDHEAANAQGINDFQWVSIIDGKTDTCCVWRDGLTSAEIEAKLKESEDACQAIVPPAHFYCRCRSVPMTQELMETEKSNLPDFDTWLDERAALAAA
jgi:hypothetical protein